MSAGLRPRTWGAAFVVAFGVVVLAAAPVFAHSELERSDPPNGGMVAEGRSTFALWFTEPVSSESSTFELHTSDGRQVVVAVTASEDGFVQLKTEPLAEATYHLDWQVLSDEDGHAEQGTVEFGVGMWPVLDSSSGGGGAQPVELILRWLNLTAVLLVVGALAVSGRVLGAMGEAGRGPRRRAQLIGASAAVSAAVLGAITPFLLTPRGGASLANWMDSSLDTVATTSWGRLWLAREIALVVVAVALWPWAVRRAISSSRTQVAVASLAAA
ncbi:MAG TPA: copper resistance CopC family protein, partial [Actinomycetes bacterium]|nr:copper resistance CopC family protein [Actinomycetes bacterium]